MEQEGPRSVTGLPLHEKKTSKKKLLIVLGLEFLVLLLVSSSVFAFFYLTPKKIEKTAVSNSFESAKDEASDGYSQRILEIIPGIDDTALVYASNDGEHLTYQAVASKYKGNVSKIVTTAAVVDGKVGNEYQRITDTSVNEKTNTIVFNGLRLGWHFAVINNVESRPYGVILGGPMISPDGKHIIYIGRNVKSKWAVVDGVERYKIGGVNSSLVVDTPAFSPDSKKVAFRTREYQQKSKMLVMDLANYSVKEGKAYDDVGDPIYSSTGRLAYRVQEGDDNFLVVDEKEGVRFNLHNGQSTAWDPIFSPDGKHTAYELREDSTGSWTSFAVLDNKRLASHPKSSIAYEAFSDDNNTFSYIGLKDNTTYTYNVGTGQLVSQATPTPYAYSTRSLTPSIGQSYKMPNGDEYSISKASSLDSTKQSHKYKLEIPGKGSIESDWEIKPVFSDDAKRISVIALRDGTAWYEEYDISGNTLKRMPEKPGYKIEQGSLEKPSSEAIVKSEKLTASTGFTKLIFDYNFNKKEGSGIYFYIALNGDQVVSLYEEDIPASGKDVVVDFDEKLPGEYIIKLYAEPIKKGAKSDLTVTNFRFAN